ncbi:MAG: DUF6428 family protein [Bacteroidota bacterium]
MKTNEFLGLLQDHRDKALLFEYRPGQYVGTNYHITEIKNITVDSVDCGTGTDFWKETIIQLWESPLEIGKTEYMVSGKALGILKKVDRIKPMTQDAEIRFEYGNESFHTTQMHVAGASLAKNALVFHLTSQKTDCKAKETCGVSVTETANGNLKTTVNSCGPNSDCC